jgi:hypothetical protein
MHRALLEGCQGFLHADGYAGFNGLYEADPVSGHAARLAEVACWAHSRRKLFDVTEFEWFGQRPVNRVPTARNVAVIQDMRRVIFRRDPQP